MAIGTPTAEQIKKADEILRRKREARAAAEKQAAEDARVVETPPEVVLKPGQQVPLHILNVRAREEDRRIKALHVEAAKAAAKAVSQTLAGQTRPKPKAAVRASPSAAGAPGTPTGTDGPMSPPKGSTSTRPIPTGAKPKTA